MKRTISRRMALRGVGATLALPHLDLMNSSVRAASVAESPLRIAYFYVPNGIHMDAWRPAATEELQLSTILQPLESLQSSVSVVSNLAADHCNGNGAAHEPAGGGFLIGARCKHSEEPEVGGRSVDQIIAREVGFNTPVDSLALGIDPGHRGDHGYSGTYMSHISWRSQTTPAALELNPKHLFNRLFRNSPGRQTNGSNQFSSASSLPESKSIDASILDLVQEETRALQRQVGFGDQRKLDEYLEGVRSIERRIQSSQTDAYSHHQDAFTEDPLLHADEYVIPELIIPDGNGIPASYEDHVSLMLDILTLAFQTDTTRVASFLFSYEKSGRSYPEIEAPGSHHSTSHHKKQPKNLDQLTKINRHHMELFARMLQRMSKIQEGDSTLLDNTLILYGSGISDGNRHNHDDLPILLAGGAAGRHQGGRHVVLSEKTPICNLYLDMLSAAGAPKSNFGDSTGALGLLS